MGIFYKLPKLLRFLVVFILSLTSLFVLLRFAFYLTFNPTSNPVGFGDFVHAMWLGFRFDLRMVVVMVAPLFFLGGIKWFSPFVYRGVRIFWLVYLTIIFTVIALFYIVDFGHYAYLNQRLDFSATRFLQNLDISMQMVWESYHVVWISLAYAAVVAVFALLTHKLFIKIKNQNDVYYSTGKVFFISFISFLVMFVMGYSKLSQYPLRWSDAAFSKNNFANQLAYNPVHYFLDTMKNGRIAYDKNKVHKYYDEVADFLGVKNKDNKTLQFQRRYTPKARFEGKPNVVIVIMESFAAYKSSLSGNPLDSSPHVKSLAENGWYFKNYFTPTTGTARSVYCTLTGLPDVEFQGTSSRNPLIANQHSIIEDFKGYSKAYFIGGSASWGNIRGMLNQSMDNLHLYEEKDYDAPRNDVWGISDADLAIEANKKLAQTKEPFFAIIQTSGNHRPYTIPDNAHGFKVRTDVTEAEAKRYGFGSVKEFNSFRFLDYSVGLFIEQAKKEPYFKNTIFMFWGDHGIAGYAGAHVTKGESSNMLGLGEVRVPFIIYSPLIKEPKVFDKVVSEVDVLATAAGLTGTPYIATTFGRDMFDSEFDDRRYSFTIDHSAGHRIGMVGSKYYFRMKEDGSEAGLYDIYSNAPMKDHSKEHPKLTKYLRNLTRGLFETAKYMPYFNKREDAR